MLKSLSIKNFQSHKNTFLDLHPGVNAIIGPTDSGKSSILRALYLLLENKPPIDRMRGWYCDKDDEVIVEATDVNGITVTRRKQGKDNEYLLSTFKIPFKGMKQSEVPEDILKVLNMGDVCIQKQKDNFFLFNSSPPDVARYLNKIVNLDVIDTAHSNIESKKREIKSSLTFKSEELVKKQEELLQYTDLDTVEKSIVDAEVLEKEIIEYRQSAFTLSDIIEKVELAIKGVELLQPIIDMEERVNKAIEAFKWLEKYKNTYINLFDMIEDLEVKRATDKQASSILGAEKKIEEALQLWEMIKVETKAAYIIDELIIECQNKQRQMDLQVQIIKDATVLLDKLMPNRCPLCGHYSKEPHTKLGDTVKNVPKIGSRGRKSK